MAAALDIRTARLKDGPPRADTHLVRPISRLRQQAGFTLVEVMVAAMVTLTGFLAVAAVFDLSKKTTHVTRARDAATSLTRELVEAARGVPYAEITDASILTRLQSVDPSLADREPGNPYTVERRGVVYTITAETCIVDDGRDGGGTAPRTGDFCADSVAAGTNDPRSGRPDRIPEDYKRVDVVASWKHEGRQTSVRQTTLVNNPGSAGAPAIMTLTPRGVGTPPVVGPTKPDGEASTTSIIFDLTTSSQPATVRWLLDGVSQAVICSPCSGKAFSFTWDLEVPSAAKDGPYLISAEAYDSNSVAGPTRSTTIVLNRRYPKAPDGFAGGRNTIGGSQVVELEWLPNPERDLTGYVVTREEGSVVTTICGRQLKTTCTDPSPPDADTVIYRVTPYDVAMDGVTPRASIYSSTVKVIRDNKPPFAPVTPRKVVNADGSITLSWAKPSPEDPDTGDSIAFYRIYRDGTSVTDRYSRHSATGTSHTYTDGDAGGDRRYWIVAVDSNYAESVPVEALP